MTSLTHDHFPLLLQLALDLFRRPSPSGGEYLVRPYIAEHFERHGFTVTVDSIGNVLAVRGVPDPDEGYPLLSFHMDCVSSETTLFRTDHRRKSASTHHRDTTPLSLRPPEALTISRGWLQSRGAFVLGGDDKCGGAIALTLAATTNMPLKIVASVQEEIGCVGIRQVDPRFFDDVAYALVLDRRGANHLIVSIGGHVLCQGTFAGAMMRAAAATGLLVYATEGALSDALVLSDFIPNVVNLSVGYYHPHTVEEQVSLLDLWHSYQWVSEALSSLPRSRIERPFPQDTDEDLFVCSHCQLLTIPLTSLEEELWRFVCLCNSQAW